MPSAKKKSEGLCNKCAKKSTCEYKLGEGTLALIRCLDFIAKEHGEEKK